MVVFAGPVFPEWCWGPIFFALLFGPPLAAAAFGGRLRGPPPLQDGRCSLHRLAGSSTSFFEGPCRELRTPRGLPVLLGTSQHVVDGGEAFAPLDGTLVRLSHRRVTDRDVLAYFDALEPVAPGDLEFKRG